MADATLQDGLASTNFSQLSPMEIVEQCKRGISLLCDSVAYLRDQTCIDLLKTDTEWMHSLSVLASLFDLSPSLNAPRQPLWVAKETGPTLEGLAAQVTRMTNQYVLLERRLNSVERRSVNEIRTNQPLRPQHQEPSKETPNLFTFSQLRAHPPLPPTVNQSIAESPRLALDPPQWSSSFYIHTHISPTARFPISENIRLKIEEVVDPTGMRTEQPRSFLELYLLKSDEILVAFGNVADAVTGMNRLQANLPNIIQKPYILRWPGKSTPYLMFKITNSSQDPDSKPTSFQQALRRDLAMCRRFLASKIMETFPMLRSTEDQEEELKNFTSLYQQVLILVLHGRTFASVQEFSLMNPEATYEGFNLSISASYVADVHDWPGRIVAWNAD